MARGYPDFEGEKSGLYLTPEWAAKEGKDVTITDSAGNVSYSAGVTKDTVIPADTTRFIVQASWVNRAQDAADADKDQMSQLGIAKIDPAPTVNHCLIGGNGGGQANFPKPLKFATGETLRVVATNWANHDTVISFTLTGYDITT